MDSPKKYIAHLDLDCFFVSVERIGNPDLIRKAVVVGGSPTGRGVVASASYEARAFGVHSAMPAARALKLCPHLILVRGSHRLYGEYSDRLYNRMLEIAPLVERASIDEMYLDFTGCEALHNYDLPGFMHELQKLVLDEFKLPCTIGLASNKRVAKIATSAVKPAGVIFVPHGTEREFLAPMPIDVLPGVGKKTAPMLVSRGIKTVADAQKIPREVLIRNFGKFGEYLHRISNGIGSDTVHTESQRKSISREETFSKDIGEIPAMEKILFELTESVCSTLRRYGWTARTVSLKLRYSNFGTITRSRTIEPTNYDPEIFCVVKDLLHAGFNGKMPVRLLGVGLSELVDETQTELPLLSENSKRSTVVEAVDKLRKKFGKHVIHIGSS